MRNNLEKFPDLGQNMYVSYLQYKYTAYEYDILRLLSADDGRERPLLCAVHFSFIVTIEYV